MPGWINMPIRIETRERIDKIKKDGKSYDKFLNEVLDELDTWKSLEVAQHKEEPKIKTEG